MVVLILATPVMCGAAVFRVAVAVVSERKVGCALRTTLGAVSAVLVGLGAFACASACGSGPGDQGGSVVAGFVLIVVSIMALSAFVFGAGIGQGPGTDN